MVRPRPTCRGRDGTRLAHIFTSINTTPHLCFNPANPSELLRVTIIGGTGIYQGRTGSGTLVLRDTVLEAAPNGAPLVVDTQGDFSITIQ